MIHLGLSSISADYLVPNNFVRVLLKENEWKRFCKHANSRRTRSFQRPYRIWIEIIDAKYQTTCNTNMELSRTCYLKMLSDPHAIRPHAIWKCNYVPPLLNKMDLPSPNDSAFFTLYLTLYFTRDRSTTQIRKLTMTFSWVRTKGSFSALTIVQEKRVSVTMRKRPNSASDTMAPQTGKKFAAAMYTKMMMALLAVLRWYFVVR